MFMKYSNLFKTALNFSRRFFRLLFPFWLVGIGSSLVLKLLLLHLLESWNIGHSKSSNPQFVSSSSRSFFARTKNIPFFKILLMFWFSLRFKCFLRLEIYRKPGRVESGKDPIWDSNAARRWLDTGSSERRSLRKTKLIESNDRR